jgi:hypothetical protein
MIQKIDTISTFDMPDTVQKTSGYEYETVPEATSANMVVLLNKINELVNEVNRLKSFKIWKDEE